MKNVFKNIKKRIKSNNLFIIESLKDVIKEKDTLLEKKDKEREDMILELNKYKSDLRTSNLKNEELTKLNDSLNKAVILCNEKITNLESTILGKKEKISLKKKNVVEELLK